MAVQRARDECDGGDDEVEANSCAAMITNLFKTEGKMVLKE